MGLTKRADLLLVERGLYESRARAQAAIAAGLVTVDGAPLTKASRVIDEAAVIDARAAHPYVSRGGVKLAAALDHFAIDPKDRDALDIGASTGGFTDLLLKRGARHVIAVDVGHDQFHHSLRGDPRIDLREGCDVRSLKKEDLKVAPSLITIDVSFISLTLIIPHLSALAAEQAICIALIKPQFEVGRAQLKKGIVRDEAARRDAVTRVTEAFQSSGWTLRGVIDSPIEGGDGNREYLLCAECHR